MQLEEHFLAAVVASERVERWLDALRAFKRARGCGGAAPLVRAKQALRELVAALDSEAYVAEVRKLLALRSGGPVCHLRPYCGIPKSTHRTVSQWRPQSACTHSPMHALTVHSVGSHPVGAG